MGRGPGVRIVGPESVQLDFRWKDQRHRLRLRLAPTKANIEHCKRWKRKVEDEIALGTFVWEKHFPNHPNPLPDQSTLKLREFLLNYIKTLAGQIQPETIKEYEQCAEIVAAGLHDPPLEKATRAAFRTWISKQALSKNRIDNLLTPVRGAFRQALEDGTLNKNPLEGFQVRRIKTDTEKEIDPFTPKEVEALGKTECGDLWTLWAWTGPRSGEVIGFRRSDVGRDHKTLTIRRAVRRGREKETKTVSGIRTITLLQPAREALKRLATRWDGVEEDGPLLINPRTHESWHEAKALNRQFARDCIKAKVRRRYVYQLRHTFATWALSSGENPAWIAKQMGHSDTAMLYKHYGKWMPQLDPKAGSRMLAATKKRKHGA